MKYKHTGWKTNDGINMMIRFKNKIKKVENM